MSSIVHNRIICVQNIIICATMNDSTAVTDVIRVGELLGSYGPPLHRSLYEQ